MHASMFRRVRPWLHRHPQDTICLFYRGDVKATPTTKRDVPVDPTQVWARTARFVLLLLVVLIAVTPITQSIWIGDNFLQGQDDTEYTLLMNLTFLSLALFLGWSTFKSLTHLLSLVARLISLLLRSLWPQSSSMNPERTWRASNCDRLCPSDSSSCNLPLLI